MFIVSAKSVHTEFMLATWFLQTPVPCKLLGIMKSFHDYVRTCKHHFNIPPPPVPYQSSVSC